MTARNSSIRNLSMLGLMAGWILGAASCAPKTPAQTEIPGDYSYNENGKGLEMTLTFTRGKSHNHPLMAIWIENEKGEYLQTLYVAESIGKGIFHYGQTAQGKWMPGEIRRPAAVPYWAHKRNIQAPDGLLLPTPENPVADAYTGPTPPGSFIMHLRTDTMPPTRFRLMFEINQTWDWNEYWTNNKYPDDKEYKTSSQPALVYMADIDLDSQQDEYLLKPVGHSHPSGKTGELYTDLGTLTTALDIAAEIRVKIER